MTDPVSIRNIIVQSSTVEKIRQVQEQQGDLHQRYMANPNVDEAERRSREVQTSQETAEGKIRERKRSGEKEKRGRKKVAEAFVVEGEDMEGEESYNENGPGKIIDIKV